MKDKSDMPTATAHSARSSWTAHSSSSRPRPKSSTTPHGLPVRTPASVGVRQASLLTPELRSPQKHTQTASPSYFGLVVEPSSHVADSNTAAHVKQNWSPPSSIVRAAAIESARAVPLDANPAFEAFRRQSESNSFNLSHGNLSHLSMGSSAGAGRLPTLGSLAAAAEKEAGDQWSPRTHLPDSSAGSYGLGQPDRIETDDDLESSRPGRLVAETPASSYDMPRNESPMNIDSVQRPDMQRSQISRLDDRHPRLSLPQNRLDLPSPPALNPQRADTLPTALNTESFIMVTPQNVVDLLKSVDLSQILLLDLRVAPQYAISRIRHAMNLCIPTTLLKRPSFNAQKLSDTFTIEAEKQKFMHWRDVEFIVVYDAQSTQLKDATSSVNTLKKFSSEGWHGKSYIIRGGFIAFSEKFPEMVANPNMETGSSKKSNLTLESKTSGSMPVAGGCPMPAEKSAANPFFGNIRQNMDLLDGVGQMPVQQPEQMTDDMYDRLPAWIQKAADEDDNGKIVSDRFLKIEQAEQQRMQKALSTHVSYGTPAASTSQSVQMAGIEKGNKNRYKDILPFDHSRVRLQNVPMGGCDYINASHIQTEWSNKRYIAAQAPVPATFEDFWRLVWEQDVRVVVMLTAEAEGGQRKSDPYWLPNTYGQMKVKALSEKKVALELPGLKLSSGKSHPPSPAPDRPAPSRRRATNPHGVAVQQTIQGVAPTAPAETPFVIVRKLTLSHESQPFQPMREITQLQYSSWPDFGAPAHPAHLLALIEHCNAVVRSYSGTYAAGPQRPAKEGERPMLVHCSAGCGRTGTFVTVDSVIDMLKRQKIAAKGAKQVPEDEVMDVDLDDWVVRDDQDLVAKTVESLRYQRLSMVQTLRQFVLCYESVLEWMIKGAPGLRRDGFRRSYQG